MQPGAGGGAPAEKTANRRHNLDAVQRNIDTTKDLGFVTTSLDVKAHSDLSLVEEAAKRLQ